MRDPIDVLRSLKKYASLALPSVIDAQGQTRTWEVRLAFEEGAFRRPFCRVGTAGQVVAAGPYHLIELTAPFNLMLHPVERATAGETTLEAERVRGMLLDAFRRGRGPQPAVEGLTGVNHAGSLTPAHYHYAVTAVGWRGAESAPERIDINAVSGGAQLSWTQTAGARRYRIYRGTAVNAEHLLGDVEALGFVDNGSRSTGALVKNEGRGYLGAPERCPLWNWDGVPFDETSGARGEPDMLIVRDLQINVVPDPRDDLRAAVACDLRLTWYAEGWQPNKTVATDGLVITLDAIVDAQVGP